MLNIKTGSLNKRYTVKHMNIKNDSMVQRLNALGLNHGTDRFRGLNLRRLNAVPCYHF